MVRKATAMARRASTTNPFRSRFLLAVFTGVLLLLVFYPLLSPGHVAIVDAVFGRKYPLDLYFWSPDTGLKNMMPIHALLALAYLIPFNSLVGKVFFVGVCAAASIVAGRLAQGATGARLYTIGLVTVNPWICDRLSAGQVGVIGGYAALPVALFLTLRFIDAPSRRLLILTAITYTVVGAFDVHLLYLLPPIVAIGLIWRCATDKDVSHTYHRLVWCGALGVVVLLLALYWLIPALFFGSPISQFTRTDLLNYATRTDPKFGVVFSTAALYGFWREIVATRIALTSWWILAIIVWTLTLIGFTHLWRERKSRWIAGAAATTWLFALVISMGISFAATRPLWLFLFEHVPGFAGLREPQKASAFLVIVYAYLGAIGVETILKKWPSWRINNWVHPAVVVAALVCVPLLAGAGEFRGLSGLLHTSEYPKSWYEAATYLQANNRDDGAVLFLPWHLYMPFPFTHNQTIANPAPVFFPGRVISGDNVQLGATYTQTTNPVSEYIDAILRAPHATPNIANLLAPIGVKYIILSKILDYRTYDFLQNARDIRLITDSNDLTLFENMRYVGRLYAVDSTVVVRNFDTLIQQSQDWDLTAALYQIDSTDVDSPTGISTAPASAVPYTRIGGDSYRLSASSRSWLIFADPFNRKWHNNRQTSIANLGATNAFPASRRADILSLNEAPLLVSCTISMMTFVFLLFDLVRISARDRRAEPNTNE